MRAGHAGRTFQGPYHPSCDKSNVFADTYKPSGRTIGKRTESELGDGRLAERSRKPG